MKKTIYIVFTLIFLIGFINLYNARKELATYQSPDGNYVLTIKSKRNLISSTMPGDGGIGSMPVEVILKDTDGTIIGKSSDNMDCSIFRDSIEVSWDLENEQVWYGKAKTIHLKTGKVEC